MTCLLEALFIFQGFAIVFKDVVALVAGVLPFILPILFLLKMLPNKIRFLVEVNVSQISRA